MAEPLLEVTDLRTSFRTDHGTARAVDGLSYTIQRGETAGIVGESGSGKSVSVRSIVRLIREPGRIDGGEIKWKGRDVLAMDDGELRDLRGNEISMVFQDAGNALDATYTVGSQVVEAIQAHRDVGNADAREEAVALLGDVGIPEPDARIDQYPHEYSGGMQQRAMVAMALANRPELLIADEPTTGLDVTTQAKLLTLFGRLAERFDTTILLITHDIGVVAEACDTTLVMYAGRIVEHGATDDVLADPRHPYTVALLASVPHLHDRGDLTPIEGRPPNPTNLPVGCRFHPRCPKAKAVCRGERPPDVPFEDGRGAACYVYTEGYD